MKINDLKMKREDLREEVRGLLDNATNQRDLDSVDELQEEIDQLDEEIEVKERERNNERDQIRRDRGMDNAAGPANGADYRDMFGSSQSNSNFEDIDEYLEVIASQRHDPRLQERQHIAGEGKSGGFAVPEEFAEMMLDAALEDEIVRPRATVWPMETNTRHVPAWAGLDRSSNLYGGFTGEWLAEAQEATEEEGELRKITLKAEKLGIYTSISRELRDDGLTFADQLQSALRDAIRYFLDEAFLTGDGVGKPKGILEDEALITVDRQGASQIDYQDIVNMYTHLFKGTPGGSKVWVANNDILPELMTMTDAGNNLVWQPNAREGAPGNLLGIPVLLSEKTPALGDTGDLQLADLRHYAIGMRQEIDLDTSLAPGWKKDLTSLRVILRADGQGTWDKPLTPRNGSKQLSWCVALDESTE